MTEGGAVAVRAALDRLVGQPAWAAIRPATRIRSRISGDLTSGPSNGAGAGRSTYSGRAMLASTGRRGEIVPGWTAVRLDGMAAV